jgi:glycosyltransferase involved in cell wall biosynthesis
MRRLLEHLSRDGIEFHVISIQEGGRFAAEIAQMGIPVSSLGVKGDLAFPGAVARLARRLRASRPDIIHAWLYHSNLIAGLASPIGGHGALLWSIRHGHLDPDMDRRSTIWAARAGAWLSNWLPDRVICNSENTRRFHIQFGYNQHKMRVIANGFDVERFKPDSQARQDVRRSFGLDLEARLVGHFGRFHRQKGQHLFLEAASIVGDRFNDVRFLMGGRGVDDQNTELVGWIEKLGLQGKVRLLGLRDDMPEIFNALDLLAMTSLVESFPNVVGEAMACGVPCVVTEVGAAPELVADAGIVVSASDPEAIAKGINGLLVMSKTDRVDLGARARERIMQHFPIDGFLNAHRQVYARLAAPGSGARS